MCTQYSTAYSTYFTACPDRYYYYSTTTSNKENTLLPQTTTLRNSALNFPPPSTTAFTKSSPTYIESQRIASHHILSILPAFSNSPQPSIAICTRSFNACHRRRTTISITIAALRLTPPAILKILQHPPHSHSHYPTPTTTPKSHQTTLRFCFAFTSRALHSSRVSEIIAARALEQTGTAHHHAFTIRCARLDGRRGSNTPGRHPQCRESLQHVDR